MKAIRWKQEDDCDCEGKTLGCESCYRIITSGYLIGFDSDDEAAKARKEWGLFKPLKDSKAVCCHPDNWLICPSCLKKRFSFEKKTKKPFKVSLANK